MKYITEYPEPESFIYLMSPYSDPSIIVRAIRYVQVRAATAYIVTSGFPVYSPILHNHDMALNHNVDGSSDFWNVLNVPFMKVCSEGWVLMLDGWEQSRGIHFETEYLTALDKPIRYVYIDQTGTDLLMLDPENVNH